MRAPIKSEALQVLIDRGIEISTIIDVGVQHGTPELLSAFPSAHHVLIEPVIEYFEVIKKNYDKANFTLLNYAISDVNGDIYLETQSKLSSLDISHSQMRHELDQQQCETMRRVKMRTLDELMTMVNPEPAYLLKIDIDGQEMKALSGSENTLTKCSVVILEVVHSELPRRIEFLQKRGFRLFDLVEPAYYDNAFWQADAVFIHHKVFSDRFDDILTDKFDGKKWSVYR